MIDYAMPPDVFTLNRGEFIFDPETGFPPPNQSGPGPVDPPAGAPTGAEPPLHPPPLHPAVIAYFDEVAARHDAERLAQPADAPPPGSEQAGRSIGEILGTALEDALPDYGNYGGDRTPPYDTGAFILDPNLLAQGIDVPAPAPVNALDWVFAVHDYERVAAAGDPLGQAAADLNMVGNLIGVMLQGPAAVTNPHGGLPAPLETLVGYGYAAGAAVAGLGFAGLTLIGGAVGAAWDFASGVVGGFFAAIGDAIAGVFDLVVKPPTRTS